MTDLEENNLLIIDKVDKVSGCALPVLRDVIKRIHEPREFESSKYRCAVCKLSFDSNVQIRKHLHEHYLPKDLCPFLTSLDDVIFEITFRFGKSVDVVIRNTKQCTVSLGHVYVVNKVNTTVLSLDDCIIAKGDTKVFSMDQSLFDPAKRNTIITQAFVEEFEYIEHFELDACCGKPGELIKTMELITLDVCDKLKDIMTQSDVKIDSHLKSENLYQKLDYATYKTKFAKLSMLERITGQLELDRYYQTSVLVDDNEVFITNVKDKMNKLTKFDMVKFTNPKFPSLFKRGKITQILQNTIVFETVEQSGKFSEELLYDMTFHVNGYAYDMEMAALEIVYNKGIIERLFPKYASSTLYPIEREFDWIQSDITANALQMQAVRHIVEGTAHPLPYILFGPPGTGKTKTLVEAISQIYIQDAQSRILVCATSNAAADELALRLIKNFPNQCWLSHHIYRLYASAYSPPETMQTELRRSSNFDLKFIPELAFLKKFRIIVATLLIGGSLRYAELDEMYFTHLFVDECGSATEISTLLPIACAPNAKIVLSGDPKQLGPVIMSKQAANLGLEISLLERLTDLNVYQKDKETNAYNANVITKLVYNYRSHPSIISAANRLFYDGDLIAKGSIEHTHCFVDWDQLPSTGTPIIFHASSKKQSQTEHNSTSIFNMNEVHIILNYVERIMKMTMNGKQVSQSDIGIISPYTKQCRKIQEQLENKGLGNIMIATVERFQGKEKPIVLVSTTRCKMGGIGFLRCPKCLMIIIGDPHTLKTDKNWRQVLKEFKETGVCTGNPFDLALPPCSYKQRYANDRIDAANRSGNNWFNRKYHTQTHQMIREFGNLSVEDDAKSNTLVNWRVQS